MHENGLTLKPKTSVHGFITLFISYFLVFTTVAFFTLMLLGYLSLTSLFGASIIGSITAMLCAQWKNDTSELPIIKTALKLIGVIGFLPLISFGPLLIIRRNPGDLSGILQKQPLLKLL
ncbi:MAG: hypothetical protein PHT88_03135 [Candidatus Moranbacteria bacterium]|nr:hypothetical protein [Candidatus Moranbacteria bacterium]